MILAATLMPLRIRQRCFQKHLGLWHLVPRRSSMHLHSFLFPLKKEAPVAGQDTGGKGTAVTSKGPRSELCLRSLKGPGHRFSASALFLNNHSCSPEGTLRPRARHGLECRPDPVQSSSGTPHLAAALSSGGEQRCGLQGRRLSPGRSGTSHGVAHTAQDRQDQDSGPPDVLLSALPNSHRGAGSKRVLGHEPPLPPGHLREPAAVFPHAGGWGAGRGHRFFPGSGKRRRGGLTSITCARAHTCAHAHAHTHAHTHTRTRKHMPTHTCTCAHTCTHTHTRIHAHAGLYAPKLHGDLRTLD